MSEFIPGLQLSELYYQEAVRPILEAAFPRLVYSASLIGPGSEVLGYDTPQSMDHDWGPTVKNIAHAIGSINQLVDSTDVLTNPSLTKKWQALFLEE